MKYRKKQIEVEAIIWTGKNERKMFDFLTDNTKTYVRPTLEENSFRIDLCNGGCQIGDLIIKTKEGEMKADIGDYVIREPFETDDRKFYPCKPNIFKKTYDEIGSILNEYVPWIPVSERLPEKPEYDCVLVRIDPKEGHKGIPIIADLKNGIWEFIGRKGNMEEILGVKVTHWKPIPNEEV